MKVDAHSSILQKSPEGKYDHLISPYAAARDTSPVCYQFRTVRNFSPVLQIAAAVVRYERHDTW